MLDVRQIRMCVVRRLRKIDPDPENRKVVEKFGHTRYAYAVGPGNDDDVILDCIPRASLQRLLVMVTDMYDFAERYSIDKRMNSAKDCLQEKRSVRFFCLRGYQFTSIPMVKF